MKAIITGFTMKAGCPDETEIEFSLDNGDSVGFSGKLSLSFAGYLLERSSNIDQPLVDLCECFLEACPLTAVTPDLTELLGREFGELEDDAE